MVVNYRVMLSGIFGIIVSPSVPIYSKFLKHLLIYLPLSFHIPCF